MSNKPLFTGSEWTTDLIEDALDACEEIARDELELDYYPIQVEIVSYEQMIDAYVYLGMPVHYRHWSFGKTFSQISHNYHRGAMSLAYEMVINSNPCIAYCMEQNSMMMQTLVLAHAGFGHNAFFKNNYMFQEWTNPELIITYLLFAKEYIAECEEKYGLEEVEKVLDACHALNKCGVDRYKRSRGPSLEEEEERQKERIREREQDVNVLWRLLPKKEQEKKEEELFPKEPEENILRFVEKHAPELPTWKREIIRIVSKIAQYFYSQPFTKVLNEGFATFVHYYIMNRLREKGLIDEGTWTEFLISHTNVIFQPDFDDRRYRGINPYALGFKLFMDVKRICEDPTDEDKEWFPRLAGTDWKKAIKDVVANYKDESAIRQFLSPRLMRDMGFFALLDDDQEKELHITGISNKEGYKYLRSKLADMYEHNLHTPNIEVVNVDKRGDRTLTLRHKRYNRRGLPKDETLEVLEHLKFLWEFPVVLESVDEDGEIKQRFSTEEGYKDEYEDDKENTMFYGSFSLP